MPLSSRQTFSHQKGASLVEMFMVAPLLLFLGLGTVQIGLLYHAKTTLNYATFEAARVGAVSHAQVEPMMGELAYRLAPVYGGQGTEQSAGGAIARSMADSVSPVFGNISVLNPTQEMFDAWEMPDSTTGEMQIPNHHLRHQNANNVRAGVNIQDANLLKIRAEYGYELQVPFVGRIITQALRTMNPEAAVYYQAGRIPLVSVATVRMQNEARRSPVVVAAAATPGASSPEFGESSLVSSDWSVTGAVNSPQSPSCDEFGLGDSNGEFESLFSLAPADGEEIERCEAPASLATIYDGLGTQPLQSSGLNSCG